MPDFHKHMDFIMSRPYRFWAILIHDGKKVGSVYLTHKWEVGIQILQEYWGCGMAQGAMLALIQMFGKGRYLANIAPGNVRSRKFFRNLGFDKIQETYEYNC